MIDKKAIMIFFEVLSYKFHEITEEIHLQPSASIVLMWGSQPAAHRCVSYCPSRFISTLFDSA
jgi:hypothetical protein